MKIIKATEATMIRFSLITLALHYYYYYYYDYYYYNKRYGLIRQPMYYIACLVLLEFISSPYYVLYLQFLELHIEILVNPAKRNNKMTLANYIPDFLWPKFLVASLHLFNGVFFVFIVLTKKKRNENYFLDYPHA